MSRIDMPVKVTTGKYEIITSGIVHTNEKDINFKMSGLNISFNFKSDSGTARFQGVRGNKSLVIELYNTENVLGEGKLEPVEIGTIENRALYATWFINTLDNKVRQFIYTFLLKDE